MPRSKKAASRGKGRGAYSGRGKHMTSLATSFVLFAGASTGHDGDGHSLQPERSQAERHQSSRDSNQGLRHMKVNFVSAGDHKRQTPSDHQIGLADIASERPSRKLDGCGDDVKRDMSPGQDLSFTAQKEEHSAIDDEITKSFIINIKGGEPVVASLPPPQVRSTSPTPSNSSDEVIVFAGRDRTGRGLSKLPSISKTVTDSHDTQVRLIENKTYGHQRELADKENIDRSSKSQRHAVNGLSRLQMVNELEPFAQTPQITSKFMTEVDCIQGCSRKHDRNNRSGKMKYSHKKELIDDYISNINEEELNSELSYNRRDLGGTDSDPWLEIKTPLGDPAKKSLLNGRECSHLRDFDALSTSDEVFGSVQSVLAKRNRKHGQQYLVVWEDHSMDGARWVSTSSLTDVNSMKLIAQFEAEEKTINEALGGEEDDNDLKSVGDSRSDEYIEDSDEDLELSELLLYDHPSEADLEGDMKLRQAPKPNHRASRYLLRTKRAKSDFPAAATLADAYDGFDVMDFDRPSLKKKSKGRKGRLPFDLSDSGLEASMTVAWDKDRSKKKDKKVARQALRAHGLLGKNDAKPDLKAKYKEGMGIRAVKEEIKSFLMGHNATLTLPPMDKANRKVVHELANAFNLGSKSTGNGDKRFPVLHRTSRTISFSENKFNAVETRLARRYLPRMDLRRKNPTSTQKRSGRGGSANVAVSYRDGDIVGGSAPELGVENKGRAMLEKMGWSNGTALGALNNKGILQPVPHVVKTTKAGLG